MAHEIPFQLNKTNSETTEYLEKTSRCRVENQQPLPTYDAGSGNRTRATFVGGECSHHHAIPAPREFAVHIASGPFLTSLCSLYHVYCHLFCDF